MKKSPDNVKESTPLMSSPPDPIDVPPPPRMRSYWVRLLRTLSPKVYNAMVSIYFRFNVSIAMTLSSP